MRRRQLGNAALVDDLADVGAGRLEQRRFRCYRDLFAKLTHFHPDRDRDAVADTDFDSVPAKRLEAALFRSQPVLARQQIADFVVTLRIRFGGCGYIGRGICSPDCDAWDGSATRIDNLSENRPPGLLRGGILRKTHQESAHANQ